jgi:signal transduction histidine kinase
MPMNLSRLSRLWVFGVCALVGAQAVVSLTLHRSFALIALSDITQLILLLSGTAALLLNAFRTQGRTRVFWTLMTLGLIFWSSYQCLWTFFELYLRRDVPNPFGGDVVLFLHLVPMMAALAVQPHREPGERSIRAGTLDFAMLLFWWIYLYLFTVIPWQYVFRNETLYEHNLNIVYLTEKIVFLAGLGTLWWYASGSWRIIYANFFGASITYASSSYLANWAIERHVYFSGSIYDVPLAASIAWVTWIGLIALRPSTETPARARSDVYGVWIARVGMICVFSLPLFAACTLFDRIPPQPVRTFRMAVTLASMMAMGVMVFFKQHLLDRELLRLLTRSRDAFDNLQRVQAQLVQSEKLASLGQLVGGAAHELNNPIAAMMGYSDMLGATPLSTEQRRLAGKIEQQIRRTRTLVSSLLSFAKQTPAEKALLDLNSLVQTAVKLSPPQLRGAPIQVHTNLTPDLPKVFGDSNQLLQVCLHVTNNALHAMDEKGGTLTVRTFLHEDLVIVEFSDQGRGIQEPDRIFDPFYTTRPVGQGLGLGLSACYGIIQEHGGKISGHNQSGGGAIFRIELPAGKEPSIGVMQASTTSDVGAAVPSASSGQALARAR